MLCAAACAPKTGLLLEVQGPGGPSSVEAGIVELRLIAAHHSYCDRWITDQQASLLTAKVGGRDLDADPLTILLVPDKQTGGILNYDYPVDQDPDPVRAEVLALDANGKLVGIAAFDPHPFAYEELRRYTAHVELLRRTDLNYVSTDGCLCAPGVAAIGNGSGKDCDLRVPASFERLVDTAGCELPPGETNLPIGACDGQLYPGERQNREIPCFLSHEGSCRVGLRTCNDTEGLTYDRECLPDNGAPALPGGTLCDAYLGCERDTCGDPGACLQASTSGHKSVHCVMAVATDPKDGAAAPCTDGGWVHVFDGQSGPGCVATMLDGIKAGPFVLGWKKDASDTEPHPLATFCPPTFFVAAANADPSKLPSAVNFSITIGDQIFDVTLSVMVGCSTVGTSPSLRCTVQ